MHRPGPASQVSLLLCCCAGALFASGQQFIPLGDLPGGEFDSTAYGVSDHGRWVVGEGAIAEGTAGFRYDVRERVLAELPGYVGTQPPLEGRMNASARAVSNDGSRIIGYIIDWSYNPDRSHFQTRAAIWDDLGAPFSFVSPYDFGTFENNGAGLFDLTPDGTLAVGVFLNFLSYEPLPMTWDDVNGAVEPPTPTEPSDYGYLRAVSADGTTWAGTWDYDSPESGQLKSKAYLQSAAGSITLLGALPGHIASRGYGLSPDGSRVVGKSDRLFYPELHEAFVWDATSGMVGLGDLGDTTDIWSTAYAISDTGVTVGTADAGPNSSNHNKVRPKAFVHDATNGLRSLESVLEALDVDLGGYQLTAARDISPDGRFIVGEALNPDGKTEAFYAQVPEPQASLGLWGGCATLGLMAWRRRRRRAGRGPSDPPARRSADR